MPEIFKFLIGIIILTLAILYYAFIIIPVREEIAEGERARKINRFVGSTTAERSADALHDSNPQEYHPNEQF